MKKLFVIILSVLIFLNIFPLCASAEDYSDKSTDELQAMYDSIRCELLSRNLREENKQLLFDESDIQIYVDGEFSVDTRIEAMLCLPVIIINNSDKYILVQLRDASVNGWVCDTYFSSRLDAGKKIKDTIKIGVESAGINSLDDFEELTFSLYVTDYGNREEIKTTDRITFYK